MRFANRSASAELLSRMASYPTPDWMGDWNQAAAEPRNLQARIAAQTATGALPVFTLYAIPHRDCGSYSAGGFADSDQYAAWINQIAMGIGSSKVVIILEPDALPSLDCLTPVDQRARLQMIDAAVTRLTQQPNVAVYLDAGNEGWQPANVMIERLKEAGIAKARGFSLNVSNFFSTSSEEAYGDRLSEVLGGEHFLVDTSRNGLGSNGEWCNPAGRALGTPWTTATGDPNADALLWVKIPGESDGPCQGGPAAGGFWTDYALGLAHRTQFLDGS